MALLSDLPGVWGWLSAPWGSLGRVAVCSLVSWGSRGSWAVPSALLILGLKDGPDLDLEWRTWTPTPALRRVGGALGVQWGPCSGSLHPAQPCTADSGQRGQEGGARGPGPHGGLASRPAPRDRAPTRTAVYRRGLGGGLSGPQAEGAEGRRPCRVHPPRTSSAPDRLAAGTRHRGGGVWFPQKDTCAPSYPPRGRRQ